jgi:thiamine biosynthesis lipoprotein
MTEPTMNAPMAPSAMTRRRLLKITAASAGISLLSSGRPANAGVAAATWRGTLLGAVASLEIHHENRDEAERLLVAARAEARRLERLFSLYLSDSALVELNRTGVLVDPAAEMFDLVSTALRHAELTHGLFDPTVHPLWELYAAHFSGEGADPAGPAPAALAAALGRVGWQRVKISRDRIAVPRGTAITLNGIAQGYVTDRVVELLRARGIASSLVDMGEPRVIGPRSDGRPWEIGIADPEISGRIAAVLPVVDRAVSTSGGYGFRFDAAGRFNHLFDPRTGGCAGRYRSVTTVSRTATTADATSTAFSLMPAERIRSLLRLLDVERVHLVDADGRPLDLEA